LFLIPDYKSHFEEPDRAHSYLSATSGSTLVARRAGIQQANNATMASSNATAQSVVGSFGPTSKSRVFITRVTATAAINPMAEQNIDDAEDRRVRADAKRECEYRSRFQLHKPLIYRQCLPEGSDSCDQLPDRKSLQPEFGAAALSIGPNAAHSSSRTWRFRRSFTSLP
jgi:hypothetical protein